MDGDNNRVFLLAVLLVAVIIFASAGCASAIRYSTSRNMTEQRTAAVVLLVRCDNFEVGMASAGSGVVVSRTQVITALHVVDCKHPINGSVGKPTDIIAIQKDRLGKRMKIEMVLPDPDLARLTIVGGGGFYGNAVVDVVATDRESSVCISQAVPKRDVRCGEVEDMLDSPGNDIMINTPVFPGNSGSGVYDRRGRLVGIVTRQRSAGAEEQATGSLATSLALHREVLP